MKNPNSGRGKSVVTLDAEKRMPKFTGALPEQRYTKDKLLLHYNEIYSKPQHKNIAYDSTVLAVVVDKFWPPESIELSSAEAQQFMRNTVALNYPQYYGQP